MLFTVKMWGLYGTEISNGLLGLYRWQRGRYSTIRMWLHYSAQSSPPGLVPQNGWVFVDAPEIDGQVNDDQDNDDKEYHKWWETPLWQLQSYGLGLRKAMHKLIWCTLLEPSFFWLLMVDSCFDHIVPVHGDVGEQEKVLGHISATMYIYYIIQILYGHVETCWNNKQMSHVVDFENTFGLVTFCQAWTCVF